MLPEYEIFMNGALVKEAIKDKKVLRLEIGIISPLELNEYIMKYSYKGTMLQGDIRYLNIEPVFE